MRFENREGPSLAAETPFALRPHPSTLQARACPMMCLEVCLTVRRGKAEVAMACGGQRVRTFRHTPPLHLRTCIGPGNINTCTMLKRACCTMEKLPVMSAWLAMIVAAVAITTTGHTSASGTLCQ